jgi:membrane protease YdiL (CAAX protease family)
MAAPQVWFWSLIGYPVCEELVFRGVLQRELLRSRVFSGSRYGMSLANLFTSLVFAGAHVLWFENPAQAAVLLPSLIIGHVYERAGGLPGAIVLHGWFNLVGLCWFWI